MGPKSTKESDYERLLAQERLILDATEVVVALLKEQNVSRQELAHRIGKSKGFVSQLLSGERNMTLRTLADLGHALGRGFSVVPRAAAEATAIQAGGAFSTRYLWAIGEARHTIPPHAVAERVRAAEEFAVDAHEYALAA